MMETLVCHPLGGQSLQSHPLKPPITHEVVDTIKVRMQLSRRARLPGVRDHNRHQSAAWIDGDEHLGKETRLCPDRSGDCQKGDTASAVQRARSGSGRDRTEDGYSIYIV